MGEVILPTSPGKQESEHTLGRLIARFGEAYWHGSVVSFSQNIF